MQGAWWRGAFLALVLVGAGTAQAQSPPHVVDLHVDLPYQLHVRGRRLEDRRDPVSPDRLRRGRVGTLVLPLFVPDAWRMAPARVRASYGATYRTLLGALGQGSGVLLAPGRKRHAGQVAVWLAFEGADGFSDRPRALVPWIARGACLVGPVHTRTNALAGSSSDPKTASRLVGLTAKGQAVVRMAYAHGALVDIAHASDAAVRDIVAIAKAFHAPLVCSHTGMRSLKPIERNISDEQLRWVATSGGVVGVDVHSGHIGSHAGRRASLDDFIRHLEHAVHVAGVEHVAIGSDLDGGITEPVDGDGAASWSEVAKRLRRRGWRGAQIAAVFHANAHRVLGWAIARGCGTSAPAGGASL